MKLIISFVLALTASVILCAQDATAPQSWTASDGRVMQAKFIKLDGESVVIEKDGKQFAVAFAKLNADSVELAKRMGGVMAGHAADFPEALAPLPVGKLAFARSDEKETKSYYAEGTSVRVAISDGSFADFLPGERLAYLKNGALLVRDLKSGSTAPAVIPASAMDIDFSPSGEEIVFLLRDNIHASKIDGTSSRQLTKSSKGESPWNPKWSPDGKRVLFPREYDGLNSQVVVIDADGGNEAVLSGPGGMHQSPCWSPDGTEFAFMSAKDVTIHIQRLDGTKPRLIEKSKEVQVLNGIAWSPDGQWIAYGRDGGGIWIVRPDGSDERQIITSKERPIHWMPLCWAR